VNRAIRHREPSAAIQWRRDAQVSQASAALEASRLVSTFIGSLTPRQDRHASLAMTTL